MDKKTKVIATTSISLIVVLAIILTAIFANQTVSPKSTPILYRIVDSNFTVAAGSYKAYNFTIPSEISSCQVSGSFSVTTTNSSGIRVFIWDNAEFSNWQKGQVSQSPLGRIISSYDSGLTTNGTIEASPYPGGTYFLIFQNNSTDSQNVTSQTSFWYIEK